MAQIWLTGAENPAHHEVLTRCSAPRLAFNVSAWARNNRSSWKNGLGHQFDWIAWADGPSTVEDLGDATKAMGIPPSYVIGPEEWSFHPHWIPVWNGQEPAPSPHVGSSLVVTDTVFTDRALRRRVLGGRKRDSLLGVITGKTRGVDKFDLIISSAWWSAAKNGETQVWTGTKMSRYNASRKMEQREKHSEDIEALGVDPGRVMADDSDAVAELAVRSWIEFGNSIEGPPPTPDREPSHSSRTRPEVDTDSYIEYGELERRAQRADIVSPRDRHIVLPTMSALSRTIKDPITGEERSEGVIGSSHASLRQCDNCFLAPSCPQYQAGADCAYHIPVEIRSREQLQATLQAVLEIQTQRVLQARFAEEITGQEMDPLVGREMDRLFNLTSKMKTVMAQSDSLKVTIEGSGSGVEASGGALSKLFGATIGDEARQLRDPLASDKILEIADDGSNS